jgi:hypothetical protein
VFVGGGGVREGGRRKTVITYQLSVLYRIAQSGFHAFFSLHLALQYELEHFCETAFSLESSITGNSCTCISTHGGKGSQHFTVRVTGFTPGFLSL